MRLLAIGPGSEEVAFADFVDGELQRTDLIRASGARLEPLRGRPPAGALCAPRVLALWLTARGSGA